MTTEFLKRENFSIRLRQRILSDVNVYATGYNNFRFMNGSKARRMEEHYTMHFILSGKGTFNRGGNTYALQGGDVFFCSPKELFSYYPDENDPWEYVWFTFDGDGVDGLLHSVALSAKEPVKKGAVSSTVVETLDAFLSAVSKTPSRNGFFTLSAFFAVLSELAVEERLPVREENSARRYVAQAKTCIENNYSDTEFRIEHVGQLLFLNHTYLCRLFVGETGKTMISYLRECRIEAAKKLLSTTDRKVREISFECGFGDYPHFCKIFLSETGYTPSEYRKKKYNH